jgi:hypothetical protein
MAKKLFAVYTFYSLRFTDKWPKAQIMTVQDIVSAKRKCYSRKISAALRI